jgi:Trk K+ transport system NAD-binding subunit
VGLTANDEVNSLFAGEARQDFGVPETYVALRKGSTSVTPRILEKQESHRLFDGPKDVERWNVRLRHGSARVETLHFTGIPEEEGAGENGRTSTQRDDHLVLAVRRGAGWSPMHAGFEAREGDHAAVVVHSAEEASAYQALQRLGWTAASVDDDAPDGVDAV